MATFKMFGALIKAASRPAIILAIVGIVNSVISAYYYLKVVKVMIFDSGEEETPIATSLIDGTVLVVFAIAVFALFVFWTPVQELSNVFSLNLSKF
jgi:NADH-quinone oxidoreductase subunit N